MTLLNRHSGISRQVIASVLVWTAVPIAAQQNDTHLPLHASERHVVLVKNTLAPPMQDAAGHTIQNRTWHLSGAELKTALKGNRPNAQRSESQRQDFSSAYAQAYITGIADASLGRSWCTLSGVLPHELSDRVYTYLSTQSEAQLGANGGILVTEALAQSFPCGKGH